MAGDSARKDLLLGTVLGKCLLGQKIGSGGMGDVYLGEHRLLQKKVAVKVLPPDFSRDEEAIGRFFLEARAAAKLDHPNLVQVYDVGEENGYYFIVMQYVDGKTLQDLIDMVQGPLDPKEAARIVREVAHGLKYAHEQGVVHRDIKPSNILLSIRGEVKITDFGLAFDGAAGSHLTQKGAIIGTPHFLSPEQADGRKASERSDLYSLGVVFYYLLTGEKPFDGETTMSILYKQVHETPTPPTKVYPKLPATLDPIINKLLAKKPTERYSGAEELIRDLTIFMQSRPAVRPPTTRRTHRPSSSSRVRVVPKQSPVVPILVVALLLLAAGAIGLAALLSGRKDPPREPDKPEVSRPKPPETDPTQELLRKAAGAEADGRLADALSLLEEAKSRKDTPEVRKSIERIQTRLSDRRDDAAWKEASDKNTLPAYDDYLLRFPNGRHLREASTARKKLSAKPSHSDESDFSPVPALLGCAHLKPYLSTYDDVIRVDYPADGPGKDEDLHRLHTSRADVADFVLRGEICVDGAPVQVVGRQPTGEIRDPDRPRPVGMILNDLSPGTWVEFEIRLEGEEATLSLDGKSRKTRVKDPAISSRFGSVGFCVHRGTRCRLRRLRWNVLRSVDPADFRPKKPQGSDHEKLRSAFGDFERELLLLRKPAPVREKLEKIRAELTTEEGRKELQALLARVESVERVVEGFLAYCRERRDQELEIRTKNASTKGTVKSVEETGVTIGTTRIPVEEVHAERMADWAKTATALQQGLFLLGEREGAAALKRAVKEGALLPEFAPYLDEMAEAALAEADRNSGVLDLLAPAADLLSPANAERLRRLQAAAAIAKFEPARRAADELIKRGKIKEGRAELLKILRDPAAGTVGADAARDLYLSMMGDPWADAFNGRDISDWTLTGVTKKEARAELGEIRVDADSAVLAPKDLRGAKGLAAEFSVEAFRESGAVGIGWNRRQALLSVDRIRVDGLAERSLDGPPAGKWMKIAVVDVAGTILVYLNGELIAHADRKGDFLTATSGLLVTRTATKIRGVRLLR